MQNRPRTTYTQRPLSVFLMACGGLEEDSQGANLMRILAACAPQTVFFGLGGERMKEAGLQPIQVGSARHIATQILDKNIDVVVTVGVMGALASLAKKIGKQKAVKCFHYGEIEGLDLCSGSLKTRMQKELSFYETVFCFSPREVEILEKFDISAVFVGHPLLDTLVGLVPTKKTKPLKAPRTLALLPGRQRRTIQALMPSLMHVVALLRGVYPDLKVFIPLADIQNPRHLEPYGALKATYVRGEERYEALQGCDAALSIAGRVNIPLTLLGVPVVAVKKPLFFAAIRRMFKPVPVAQSGVNGLLGELVIPELSVEEVEGLYQAVLSLLEHTSARKEQLAVSAQLRKILLAPQRQAGGAVKHPATQIILGAQN